MIASMNAALAEGCASLGLTDKTDDLTIMVAKRIILARLLLVRSPGRTADRGRAATVWL